MDFYLIIDIVGNGLCAVPVDDLASMDKSSTIFTDSPKTLCNENPVLRNGTQAVPYIFIGFR